MHLFYYKFISSFLNLLFWDINMNIFLLPLLRNNRACGHWLLTTLQVKAKLDSLQFSSWSSLRTGISNLSSPSNFVLGMNFSRESLVGLNTTFWVVVCPVFVPMDQLFNLITCSSDQTPNSDFFSRKLFCLFLKNSKLDFAIKINSYVFWFFGFSNKSKFIERNSEFINS